MRILVTGGSGFIGSHLVMELNKKGHSVYVLSNILPKERRNNFIYADITDRKKILEIIPKFDVVYHLAGLLGTSELINLAYEASRVNILGTINILDASLKRKTKVVHITKPNCWLNTYTITKAAGESFTKMYYEQKKLPTLSIKWFNVYGPNQSFHCQKAVPFFIRWALHNESIKIWGDGKQTVDLIYATDAVRATIEIGQNKKFEGKTIEVGSGFETTVNNLAKLIIKKTKSKSKIIHLSMRSGETENTRLKADTSVLKDLHFKFEYNLNRGLDQTINWYKKHLNI